MRSQKKPIHWSAILGIALGSMALTGCGEQPFVVSNSVQAQQAPGNFTIPAKVDILLAEDDTGSMNEAYPQISGAMPGFLDGLESSGWDYHFATIPLTGDRPLDQIVASRYDSNWGTLWTPPFPGAAPDMTGMVNSAFFRTPDQYSGWVTKSDIHAPAGEGPLFEPGLDSITYALYNRTINTNFLRDDALLVVLVVGNGDDTSRVNYCTRQGDNQLVPCEQVFATSTCTSMNQAGAPGATCRSGQLSLNYYASALQNLKPRADMIRFYAAVSANFTYPNFCLSKDSYGWEGSRYKAMAGALGGKSYDICSGSSAIKQTLAALSGELQGIRVGLRTRFLPIDQEPDPSTIVVTKSTGEIIPQGTVNGWTYAGFVTNGYQIDYPVSMKPFSGYAIELHGSAKLIGDVSASVNYLPKGLQNSH